MGKLRGALEFCLRHQTVLGHSIVTASTSSPCGVQTSQQSWECAVRLHLPRSACLHPLSAWLKHGEHQDVVPGDGQLPSKDALSCSPWGTCSHCCLVLPSVTARALVDPGFSWITVALLRASFYKRTASGSSLITNLVHKDKGRECHKLLLKTPCNEKLLEEIPGECLSLQAQSQVEPHRSSPDGL